MNILTKYEIGQKILYDNDKVGIIKGMEIMIRDTFYKQPIINYKIKALTIKDRIFLETRGELRNEKHIKLYEAAL